MAKGKTNSLDHIISLCKRRGFIFQSSEIYGGLAATYDYGPLGVELKKNIKDFWWQSMVQKRDDIKGIDAAILMHPKVWEASGHVAGFHDPLIDNKTSKARYRADHLIEMQIERLRSKNKTEKANNLEQRLATAGMDPKKLYQIIIDEEIADPVSGTREWTEVRQFNLMFKTFMGPVEESANIVYLRPETAQGIYVNYLNILNASRVKIPFGIAQIGKAFRNEITTKNFIFRTSEFEQMEMQFFVHPQTDVEWFEYWKEQRINWYKELGIRMEKVRFHEHGENELAHYAKSAFDIQYEFPFGWSELEGIHNRTNFDLARHQQYSGKDLEYFDDQTRERFIPYIIETSAGVDRTLLTVLVDAYEEEQLEQDSRVVMHFAPEIAPIKVGVFPLVKRDGMPELAINIYNDLKKHFMAFYDEGGAIGRRYRRQDEIGTPYCITVDSQTLEDHTVTLRYRDSMAQTRIPINGLEDIIRANLEKKMI